jgi:ATP-dependent RNA helicase DDX23/PRP28
VQDAHLASFLSSARTATAAAATARVAAERAVREDRDRKRDELAARRVAGGATGGGGNPTLSVHANNLTLARDVERGLEREKELMRYHYLGQKDPTARKIPLAPSQKFKFNFDWDAKDDTGVDTNALYKHKHAAAAAYGRGYTGGVDRGEQRKKNSFYEDLVQHRLEEQDREAKIEREARRKAHALSSSSNYSSSKSATTLEDESGMKLEPIVYDDDDDEQGYSGSSALRAADAAAARARTEKADARHQREDARRVADELKNRHWSSKSRVEMEERDWRIFKEDFSIATRGSKVPQPMRYWSEADLPETLMRALTLAGYKEPTPIQRAAIPIGLNNRDVIGIAETGSGSVPG